MGDWHALELFVVVAAMSISMAVIPFLIRWAPALGMVDHPDPRKVHKTPIPRVGGVGIVLGALIPLAIWLPVNDLVVSYLLGALVLLVFGVWDDIRVLGHYVKFLGQFIAVLLVVYHGGLYVTHFPFMGADGNVSDAVGKLFTVVAIVGMINAINHSDGLDGLAGGESLLSLGAIAYLANSVGDYVAVLIAVAVIGGVFGFLRFNTHPARVFMGDGGSQFLGFTLGFLAVYLTQVSNSALSPVVALLLLGLPVVDILAVFAQRIYAGDNWFKASKNHIHHRLLELDFRHHESVVVIYSIQAFLVLCAVLMPYESDVLLLSVYLGVCGLLFSFLIMSERVGWTLRSSEVSMSTGNRLDDLPGNGLITRYLSYSIQIVIAVFMVVAAFTATDVPVDVSVASGALFAVLLARLVYGYRLWFLFLRLILFVAVSFSMYLAEVHSGGILIQYQGMSWLFYGAIASIAALAISVSRQSFFQVTPLDYLVLLMVIVTGIMAELGYVGHSVIGFIVKLVILFYGVEVVIRRMKSRWNILTLSALASFALISMHGLAL